MPRRVHPIIQAIWAGNPLPPHIPDPAKVPPNLNGLQNYPGAPLIQAMEDFPNLAVQIFMFGINPFNSRGPYSTNIHTYWWRSIQLLKTPADVVGWHTIYYPGTPLNPTTQAARTAILNNVTANLWPIDRLIENDAIHALVALEATYNWDPLGYDATGSTYLNAAAKYMLAKQAAYEATQAAQAGAAQQAQQPEPPEWLVFNYILHKALANRNYAMDRVTVPALTLSIPGAPAAAILNHLDLVMQNAPYASFIRYWDALDTPAAGHIQLNTAQAPLQPASIEALCKRLPRGRAEKLKANNGLDLATTPGAWYLAIENPHANFMTFLQRSAAQGQIDTIVLGIATVPPVEHAATRNNFIAFKNLLAAGANVDAWVEAQFTWARWPNLRRRFWREALGYYTRINNPIHPPAWNANGGTLIHTVVHFLSFNFAAPWFRNMTPTQRVRARRDMCMRAVTLIRLVRRGNRHGRPVLGATDAAGRTAKAVAKNDGLSEIEAIL
ncbi:uncharacterized protein DSM5745_09919 [Aspergillus mulundensis]|uniref:Uncharacterized protein n=1 Tax=Aspergillus mulundensis TaxID=1810919 RepID=A0A3D8QS56_9EURO|nr:hypothetical protein DSM5745_09919 [Aspergillus mulundensis]RDW64508.1 hypothetical protein DSM5745_09919 [Aspergillus mulundensis]